MKISIYIGDLIKEQKLSDQGKSKLSVPNNSALLTQRRQPMKQQPEASTQQLRNIQGVWRMLGT